jgi:uncharacterized protein YcfJ
VDPAGTALSGAAIGAGTGALIGSASHHGGAGALIGGAVGLLTGALVGQSMELEQQDRLRRESPRTYERVEQGQPLSTADIKALAKAGITDDVIISQIRNSRVVYRLTTAEIIDLKDAGVSHKVIDYMINTPTTNAGGASRATTTYREVVVNEDPPPPIVERVYVSPGPDYVWVSGYWGWYGGRWAWSSGRWCRPPYGHSVWVAPRCERRGGTSVWISGYWH